MSGNQPGIVESAQRFWSKVGFTDTCWLWHGCLNSNGYPHLGDLTVIAAVSAMNAGVIGFVGRGHEW